MNFFQRWKYAIQISDNNPFIKSIEEKDNKIKELQSTLNEDVIEINRLSTKNEELLKQIPKETDLDIFCKKNFTEIPLLAYKQKRKIIGKRYIISLHELITYDSWEVHNINPYVKDEVDKKEKMKILGDMLSLKLIWTSDENLDTSGDYYLYPNETICLTKGDCEDHAFVMCSLDKEIGGAWGFYNKTTGHAYNCFVYNDELYVLDTVGNQSIIMKYNDQLTYKIHYIITKEHAYKLDGSISFGEIAGW